MINGTAIERVERVLAVMTESSPEPLRSMLAAGRIDREAIDNYVAHHLSTFRQMLITHGLQLDPRMDTIAAALLRQMFISGVLCGKEEFSI